LVAEWRSAAFRVAAAYEEWKAAGSDDRAHAHELYVSALAEEEIAADRLQRELARSGG
jgi:hypothetical protein